MKTAQSMYDSLQSERYSYLERGRDVAKLTIPTLLPEEGANYSTKFSTPYQSAGARGVNNLASALLLSLLPPNSPFFRLTIDDMALQELGPEAEEIKTEIDIALSRVERAVMRDIETNNIRVAMFEALKQLIVTGNALVFLPKAGGMRVFRLDRYVVKRCPLGFVRMMVTKETIAPSMLPPEVAALVDGQESTMDTVDLYTCVKSIDSETYEVFQEVGGQEVPGSRGTFAKNASPYIALRMNRVDGESYGRGYAEQYYGDLKSLEALSMAVVEGSAASAKVVFLVNPNGTTRARTLSEAPNGAIREGSAADVSTLQVGKQADLRIAYETINQINERLANAFLLTEATIRRAERVTAEEIRLVTQSIERQLGGIYSVLSQEFQLPLVNRIMERMKKNNVLPPLPADIVQPTIVTGIEALGRGQDLNKLDVFLAGVAQQLGPQALAQFVDLREYIDRRAASLGIDTENLIKSQEQIAAEQQAQQQAALTQQFGPQALDLFGKQQLKSMDMQQEETQQDG
jgi:hypothetical protein